MAALREVLGVPDCYSNQIGLKGANDARQFCSLDLTGAAVAPARTYSGSFFHPVSIDIKLFIPWIATITRCPRTKTPSIKRLAKCHMRARWNPPMRSARNENCTGLNSTMPVTTENAPMRIKEV